MVMVLGCILLCTHSILKEVQLWDTLFENGGILMLILMIWILRTYNIHTYNDNDGKQHATNVIQGTGCSEEYGPLLPWAETRQGLDSGWPGACEPDT